jgi:hypothetical protein
MNKFLTIALIISILVIDYGSSVAQKNKKPLYKAPFGVQAYTFRRSFPLGIAETLDSIKAMGFTEIEGGGGKMPPAEFKKLCNERGISIPSTGAGYENLVKDPQAAANDAKALGVS